MRTLGLSFLFGILCCISISAQVKIGDNPQTIDPAAVLELESTTMALIITRVTTEQMEAITPGQGAIVYNTDAQCIHYFNGVQWMNLCEGANINVTTDPIVNQISTIVLTETATGNNLEVAPNSIRTEQIVDGGIFGDDINDNSIGANKLARNSVTKIALSENAVGPFAIDRDSLPLSFFINDVPFLTAGDLTVTVSEDIGNALTIGSDEGAFYDEQPVLDAIAVNTTAIANDQDGNPENEVQNLSLTGNLLTLSNPTGADDEIDLAGFAGTPDATDELITNAVLTGTDLIITEGGTDTTVPLASIVSTQVVDGTTLTGLGTGADPFKIEPSPTNGQFLSTNAAGNVVWATVPTGTGTVNTDGLTIVGDGTTTALSVPDAGITPIKIEPSAVNGQVLTTDATGAVAWETLATGGGTTELADQITIVGNGQAGNTFQVADGGITTAKIQPVTPTPATNQMLVSTTAGTVEWAAVAGGGADGSETVIDPTASTIGVTGTGTTADPYVLTATAGDGSETIIDPTASTVGVTGTGTTADPYVLTATAGDGSETVINTTSAIAVAGTGTTLDPYLLTLEDDAVTTPKIVDDNVTPDKILQGTDGQVLTTDAVGDVVWAAPATVAVNTTPTIDGDGTLGNELDLADDAVTTPKIADDNVTPDKILQGTDGQVLTTDAVGDVVWAAPATVAVNTTPTIDGDGTLGNELDLADDAVTTPKIADDNVTPDKILQGIDGQVMTTDAVGDVVWAAPAVVAVNTTVTIDGDGTLGNELDLADDAVTTPKIADDNVTPDKILQGTDGQVLTTDAVGDVVWAAPATVAVNTTATIDGHGTLGNELDLADNAVTTPKIADDNVTPDKILQGTDGQVLTTDAAGDVVWAAPATVAVNTTPTIDGDGTLGNELDLADYAVTTPKIADDNVTPDKILQGTDGQVLTTDAAGDVVWAAPATVAVNTTATIDGDGTLGNELDLADDAVTTPKIADDNVTPDKILQGTDGQVLTTDAVGDVVWMVPNWTAITGIPADLADGDDNTTYTAGLGLILTGTQFAVNNASIAPDWTNITSVPGDIADGDANTTYTAGSGLTLTGTAFSVDNTAITGNGTLSSTSLTIGGGANAVFSNVTIEIPAGGIVGGAGGLIADNSITASDLATDSVDKGELRADSVGESELIDGTITPAKLDVTGTTNGDILIIDGGVPTWRAPVGGALKSGNALGQVKSIRRIVENSVTITSNDHTIILEGTVSNVTLPNANSVTGAIFVIKDLGGSTTSLSVPYRDFENKEQLTTVHGGAIWIQSDGTEWQLIK